jgi:Mrp family chromosome partitioning ATPase
MLTDASLIARVVDGTVIVVESGKTLKRILSGIVKNLGSHKVRVLGTFLNKVAMANRSSYYSYYRHYENKA